jgi:hypothetical protein
MLSPKSPNACHPDLRLSEERDLVLAMDRAIDVPSKGGFQEVGQEI